jgi:hypothetical protein
MTNKPDYSDFLDDPELKVLLTKARDAFNDLAKYMVKKAAEAGVDMPAQWTELGLQLPFEKKDGEPGES